MKRKEKKIDNDFHLFAMDDFDSIDYNRYCNIDCYYRIESLIVFGRKRNFQRKLIFFFVSIIALILYEIDSKQQ